MMHAVFHCLVACPLQVRTGLARAGYQYVNSGEPCSDCMHVPTRVRTDPSEARACVGVPR